MKKNNEMTKKLRIFQIGMILLFLLFLLIIFLPKNYTKKYSVKNIEITEKYNKKEKYYYFTLKHKEVKLDYLVESNYKLERNLITNIEIIKDEKENFCLIPTGKKLEYIPLCYENGKSIHYTLVNNELKAKLSKYLERENKEKEVYKDIEIYNKDYTYLLWNYDGFYFIDKESKKKIDIFDKEMYNVSLIGYTKDYLVIADYDSNYTFNKIYTIDYEKGNLKEYELDRNIYFDSYFIGYEKNKLYIVDNKESLMYELNVKNGKIDKISSKVLTNGNWEKVSIKTLLNKKQEFTYESNYRYTLEENKLYLNYEGKEIKTFVADKVTSIVRIKDKDIFYLKKDTLYHFNELMGEEKLLTYFEWNFNSDRMIYIN